MFWLLEQSLAAVHLLSAAAWFGALVYRAFFVDPKSLTWFRRDADYEGFALHLADGMRYTVMLALFTCGLSGFALMGLRWNASPAWLGLMGFKAAAWLVAFCVFAYISWVFWPRRVFAQASEYGVVRRQGLLLALSMIGLAGLGLLLGQVAAWARVAAV